MNKVNKMFSNIKISNLNKKNIRGVLIIVFVILVLYFIISSVITGSRNRTCQNLRNEVLTLTDSYRSDNNLLPTLNGTSETVYYLIYMIVLFLKIMP